MNATEIQRTVLGLLPFYGCTATALTETERTLPLSQGHLFCLYPRGIADFLEDWQETVNQSMTITETRVRDRVHQAVMQRLAIYNDYPQALSAIMAYYITHPIQGQQYLWQAASAVWYACGDTATDYNYYTKRTLLSPIIAKTALFWLNDSSDNKITTSDFLKRQIDNLLKLPLHKVKTGLQGIEETIINLLQKNNKHCHSERSDESPTAGDPSLRSG